MIGGLVSLTMLPLVLIPAADALVKVCGIPPADADAPGLAGEDVRLPEAVE